MSIRVFFHRRCRWLMLLLLLLFVAACASVMTQNRHYDAVEARAITNDWDAALQVVADAGKSGKYSKKDRLLYLLDEGILLHFAGRYEASNRYLESAERTIEELYTRSVSKAMLSMMLNDNALDYSGEDYEDIYVNIFKALNYIRLEQHDDALVEIRRIDIKLQKLDAKYGQWAEKLNQAKDNKIQFQATTSQFHNDALARYLGMLLYYYDGKLDDARIDFENYQSAVATQTNLYHHQPIPISPSALDTSMLHVVAFSGRAPEKVAVNFRIRTGKDFFLVFPETRGERFAQNFTWQGMVDGYHFKFALPELRRRASRVHRVEVYANGSRIGGLQLIEDMSRIAEVTFEQHKSLIYLKSIARTILKGLAGQKIKQEFEDDQDEDKDKKEGKKDDNEDKKQKETDEKKPKKMNPFAAFLAKAAVDILTDISEQADLRMWRTMPGVAHAGAFPLAEGRYDIRVRFLDASSRTLCEQQYQNIVIDRARLNLIEAVSLL